ncbi:chorismate mutase [Streptomyces kanasensis]|uniref:chorismate mutase n=1 Tax=Streptomyces kanasensis TaxID=936756 RepID=UPI0036FEC4D1
MTPTTTPDRTATTTPRTATATPTARAAAATATARAARAADRTTAEITGARTDDAAALIAGARDRVDALDDRIIGLIQERMAVSTVIQEARIASGGRRVNLARETEVLARYRDALGRPGTTLAMSVLELCRGRV